MAFKIPYKKIFLRLTCLGLLCALAGGAALAMLFYWASRDLPNITRIAGYDPPQATTVLARDGSTLGIFSHEHRHIIGLGDMSRFLPMAFLAAEDANFYQHFGIDPVAIARAAYVNIRTGATSQGGSTITQQTIKQLLLSSERSFLRKMKEAILAVELENNLSKDEILTIYLNQVYLGEHAHGVEAAARIYFGKHASDITLAESAVIAGLPQAPSRYNPFRHPQEAKNRQMYVLGRLRDLKWITPDDYAQATAEPLVYWSMPDGQNGAALWYLEEVRRLLIEFFSERTLHALGVDTRKYGEDYVHEAGLTVRTAMDPIHQEAAGLALRQGLEELDKRQGWRGPLQHLDTANQREFLNKLAFTPLELTGTGRATALVTSVDAKEARVALGQDYTGVIPVAAMSWARKPNPKVSAINAPTVKDARLVLKPGDVVLVSAADSTVTTTDAKNKKIQQTISFDAGDVRKETPIPLLLQQIPAAQGALASLEPQSGDVVALIGGYSFGDSHFNRATQARRQPGSSFKPVVYSTALDFGFTPSSIVLDAPFVYVNPYTNEVWRPSNYEHDFKGELPLSKALALSRNTCTVRVAQQIGIANVIQRAKNLGLEPHFPQELSVSLGAVAVSPLNMTQAYAAFANQGLGVRPRIITSITDANGRELYRQNVERWQAITPQNAYMMATLLKNVVTAGTGVRARIEGRFIAGKTGTTNDEHDAWFMGFTPYLVTGVYVGYDQLQSLGRLEQGGRTAAPIFRNYFLHVEDMYAPADFTIPGGIVMSDGFAYRADMPLEGISAIGGGETTEDAPPTDTSEGGETLMRQVF
ncbi:MAG: peptidoglycan transglycosylase/DD-transpeptidase [Candidatus Desulfovibrio kirbyi]|uniref:Penicillin-binding protein 1A n=1 Tax=Candidatus Desulfovibrio kirbyi TaxID=2696086 RepID=A0A6L2R639_9BACT|nr:MAG: peptidoglycan transglycosylase/DD-transpeptidase [Candidatus Desulfovibrio kirbyi]